MIAGALILLFFVSIVYKQKAISEQKSDIEIQKNFQSILTGAEISKQTENIISVPGKEIKYGCDGFSIGSLAGFNPRIVFAPDTLKSKERKLILYSLEWRVPFRITNFLYVTSPEIRYIIVDDNNNLNDDSIANQLFDLLPENINKKIVDQGTTINDENNYKIKKICFEGNCNLGGSVSGISKVDINPTDGELDSYGIILFDTGSLPYLKKESIIAAVFSENLDIYECNMKKAMTRLKKVYDVYDDRVEELKNDYPSINPICTGYYSNADLNVNGIISFSNFQSIYKNAYSDSNNLEHENQVVALHSCALIY